MEKRKASKLNESDHTEEREEESSRNVKGRKQYKLWKKQSLEKKLLKQEQRNTVKESREELNESQRGIKCTVSIAVPGSILNNAQSPPLRAYLVGQIARAAAIYQIDEIVVFDDMGITRALSDKDLSEEEKMDLSEIKQQCLQMGLILQYLECPQYLRKYLFPIQQSLEFAGVLNPLDSIHHFRENDSSIYREGVVIKKPAKAGHSFVYVGLHKEAHIDKEIQHGVRVTVKLANPVDKYCKKIKATVVPPSCPRAETGIYWGYTVRLAHSLGAVLTECSYEGGYDLTIGTSDKGESVESYELPQFKHMLIVFGGLSGLEASLEADEGIQIDNIKLLFNAYLNTCPNQGSRVIRTEEALLISLSVLSLQWNSKLQNKDVL